MFLFLIISRNHTLSLVYSIMIIQIFKTTIAYEYILQERKVNLNEKDHVALMSKC